jgi:hypothetical protein
MRSTAETISCALKLNNVSKSIYRISVIQKSRIISLTFGSANLKKNSNFKIFMIMKLYVK